MTREQKHNLYHASLDIIKVPQWNFKKLNKERETRDFGEGFYTCKEVAYPLYLYCGNNAVTLNEYKFTDNGLNILHLKNDVKWLLTVAFHRSDFSKRRKYHPLRDKIREYISSFDLIIGTISNDNYFSTMDDFIRNLIPDTVAIEIAQMMSFGVQYVSKSAKADAQFVYLDSQHYDNSHLIPYRERKAQERELMDERVEERRVDLYPWNTGKLFAQIIEEVWADVESWYKQ